MQIVVVPGICPERLAVALEQFDFAVNRKHFLDEGSPEMQQAHRERSFVAGAQGKARLAQELAQVGAQFNGRGRLASAGGAGFEQHAVGNFSRAAEELPVRKAVVTPEAADGLAFAFHKGQRRVLADGITQVHEFPVDGVFTQGWLGGLGIKENVDVLGESLDQVPAFGEAGAAFKDDFVAAAGNDAQSFRDVVILLDDCRP